jgi:hypothetical protein
MKISKLRENSADQNWEGWHILTVAETGFSMLTAFAEAAGCKGEDVYAFAERVNQTNEAGTLYPRSPISAIPCKYLRELADRADAPVIEEFKGHISEFIKANESTIRAPRILVDLHVSSNPVPPHFVRATEEVFSSLKSGGIVAEVVIAV